MQENRGLIPGLGRFPGEGNSNLLQYPCLGNSMDGGAWRAIVHGVAESGTTERITTKTLGTDRPLGPPWVHSSRNHSRMPSSSLIAKISEK